MKLCIPLHTLYNINALTYEFKGHIEFLCSNLKKNAHEAKNDISLEKYYRSLKIRFIFGNIFLD